MNEKEYLAQRFETYRTHLRAVAYRMLGSLNEADDAVQDSWLRLDGSNASDVENLKAWLTTVVGRVCLDMLRSRRSRREVNLGARMPEPILSRENGIDPEQEALLADSIGLALLVVLEMLTPAERLAFVLHDMFAVSFDEIAAIVGRSSAATRKLASRARRRVQQANVPDGDLSGQRQVVDAFLAAARDGDFTALLTVLDPDVVLRADRGDLRPGGLLEIRGARTVAQQALTFSQLAGSARAAVVNGTAGIVAFGLRGNPFSVMGFTIRRGRIVEIDILADPARLRQLDLAFLDG